MHTRRGPSVFLLLFVLLLLTGGGVAQVIFFPLTWAVATRINKPLTWWRKVLRGRLRAVLSRLWPWLLAAGALLMVMTLQVATTGFVPGVDDPDAALNVMLVCLAGGLTSILLTYVAGFAYDIERQVETAGPAAG